MTYTEFDIFDSKLLSKCQYFNYISGIALDFALLNQE